MRIDLPPPRLVSVAPMLDWTDRHCRYLLRLISQHTWLYTEMITTGAILHGDRERHLAFDVAERPVALQLGGSDPAALANCAKLGEAMGYDEINLNIGCPSARVQTGRFGACLMAEPQLVATCITAMRDAVNIPVTVKTRIGIDHQDTYPELCQFIQTVAQAGCEIFIIHARKAWLTGLNPKQNREIPPLRYDIVQQLTQDFPQLQFILNGGITHLDQICQYLEQFSGVMLGRGVYHNPLLLATVDQRFYASEHPPRTSAQIIDDYVDYAARHHLQGVSLQKLTRPLLGLFQGQPGARQWRRYLSENAHLPNASIDIIHHAATKYFANNEGTSGYVKV